MQERTSKRRTRWFWISIGVFFAVMYLTAYLDLFREPSEPAGPVQPVVHASPR